MGKGKFTVRSITVRLLVIIVGVVIQALGMAAIVLANLGSDPITAFVQGLGKTIGLTFGNAMIIFNLAFLFAVLILNWRIIGIGTIVHSFTVGSFVDAFMPMISNAIGSDPSLPLKIGLLVLGTVALGVGLGFYQSAEFGAGTPDAFNQIIAKKLGLQLRWWRLIFDGLMIGGALLMGGVVYFGTLLGMLLTGPILGPVLNKMAPVVNRWSGNEDIAVETR